MDPDANLKEQLELAHEIQELWDQDEEVPDTEEIAIKGERLAELVLALHEWRKSGGFDPYTEPSTEDKVKSEIESILRKFGIDLDQYGTREVIMECDDTYTYEAHREEGDDDDDAYSIVVQSIYVNDEGAVVQYDRIELN